MADVFLGSLMCVPYNFAPKGFAFCAGQILPISQNTALFALLGTTYGGNGQSTFALPDLQGRISISSGQGPGLGLYSLGENGGVEAVTLPPQQIPVHTHGILASDNAPTVNQPANADVADTLLFKGSANLNVQMSAGALSVAGGSQPHNNLMPYLTLNWIIALQGIFPSRP